MGGLGSRAVPVPPPVCARAADPAQCAKQELSPHHGNHPGELLAVIAKAALPVPEQLCCSTSTAKVWGLALGLPQKCNLMKISGRGGRLSAHKAPGRGEVTALLRAPCSPLNPPAHHRPNPPPWAPSSSPCLPQTNQEQPRNPFTTHLSSSASTLGPKVGGKKPNPASLLRARRARCCESILSIQPSTQGQECR